MTTYPIGKTQLKNKTLCFSALTCGWQENSEGDVIMCLHGFPDHASTFRYQMPVLAKAGYRVICPALRGYEPGSIPALPDYRLLSLLDDVLSWVKQINPDRLHLIGHDWGASLTYLAGAVAPHAFTSLTTLAVPHGARFLEGVKSVPRQKRLSWYMMFFQIPALSDLILQLGDWALIRKLWRDWSPDYTLSEQDWADLRRTFEAPGVKAAMLAYYRQNIGLKTLLGLAASPVTPLTRIEVPTLAITGAEDGCIATEMYDYIMHDHDFPAGLRIRRIRQAGHFVHLEKADEVNQIILDWLSETRQTEAQTSD